MQRVGEGEGDDRWGSVGGVILKVNIEFAGE